MQKLAILACALLVPALAGTAAAAPGRGGGAGAAHAKNAKSGVPAFPTLPGVWSHAEINVKIRRQLHTLILDRGRVQQATGGQLTLAESDGSTVVVQLARKTIVQGGRRRLLVAIRRPQLFTVETMRIDGGPAVRVRVVRMRAA